MKKGELTTQQLITIIILIVSFSVLLFFIFRLNLGGETTNKEICHNSVLMKSKSSIGGELDCRTNYICISGGGECEGFTATDVVKVDTTAPDAKEQVMRSIADEMADCWWMFGEGEVDYMNKGVLSENYCSICSVLAFDEKVQDYANVSKFSPLSYNEFYNNLKTMKKDNSQTYLNYLYNTEDPNLLGSTYLEKSLKFNEQYLILTGLGKEGYIGTGLKWTVPGMVVNYFTKNKKEEVLGENIPVMVLGKSSSISNEVKCDEFLTKA